MIYVECKPDTVLARSLAHGQAVEHLSGTSRVCHKLREQSSCKGFVDGDPSAQNHSYIKELKKLGSVNASPQHDLVVYEDKARDNRLILLMPRLEEWILQAAYKANVRMEQFKLPSDAITLHDVLTLGDGGKMGKFRMLVQRLNSCSACVQALESLLR